MSPLNSTLYNLLRFRFGDVRTSNPGESLIGEYKFDPIKDHLVLDIESWGEMYCVNCPYCNESRQRLCISHRYGVYDELIKSDNNRMVRCFNEECLKKDQTLYKDLWDKIFGLMNASQRRSISYLRGRPGTAAPIELTEAPPPGDIDMLCELPDNHHAIEYLKSRNYDVTALMQRWNLMYCRNAAPKYALAHNRIIIPITQDGTCVGWQARYVGDIDWKAAGIPKYYTLPSMAKRLILYNHDVAFKQKMIAVTEGPTSCWTVWPFGIALLGKQATIQQQRMIIAKVSDKPIIVLLDSDAKYEAEKLSKNLKPRVKGNVVVVTLPDDLDPGSYTGQEDQLWELVIDQARQQGTDIREIVDESRRNRNEKRNDASSA